MGKEDIHITPLKVEFRDGVIHIVTDAQTHNLLARYREGTYVFVNAQGLTVNVSLGSQLSVTTEGETETFSMHIVEVVETFLMCQRGHGEPSKVLGAIISVLQPSLMQFCKSKAYVAEGLKWQALITVPWLLNKSGTPLAVGDHIIVASSKPQHLFKVVEVNGARARLEHCRTFD